MTGAHHCEKCRKWGCFGERLPDVPEADFPTKWYCRDHLPVDYFDKTARDRLRANYRPGRAIAADKKVTKKQGALFDL